MRVKLKKRWGGYLPNQEVSVSAARAAYLEELGVGKILDPPAKKAGSKAKLTSSQKAEGKKKTSAKKTKDSGSDGNNQPNKDQQPEK